MSVIDGPLEIPPWFRVIHAAAPVDDASAIVLRPGRAFGDGRHETTQLCLQTIGHFAPRPRRPFRLLDLGSGSGISVDRRGRGKWRALVWR